MSCKCDCCKILRSKKKSKKDNLDCFHIHYGSTSTGRDCLCFFERAIRDLDINLNCYKDLKWKENNKQNSFYHSNPDFINEISIKLGILKLNEFVKFYINNLFEIEKNNRERFLYEMSNIYILLYPLFLFKKEYKINIKNTCRCKEFENDIKYQQLFIFYKIVWKLIIFLLHFVDENK